ncbi:hypothetical protein [Leptospira sp. GIMC2001]|uniref:hypothetical protein n=1 Tax=Leptospira sp. GIMC2001 TaxID=1513297 RepID=UPI00234A883F|nr:hypothetical protein [Leptospira sp. GIMC2001]WCL50894.1 hypothetical protein O4O04_08805 [Leptospira sp. GIMC2001]
MQNFEKIAWEIRNEKNKSSVRWLLFFIIVPYLSYLLITGRSIEIGRENIFNWYYIISVALFVAIVNISVTILLMRGSKKSSLSPALKYFTMIADFFAVALVMIPTGGSDSMFFVINYVVIVSNGLRYGLRIAILGTIVMNIFYIGVICLEHYPDFAITGVQNEFLKLGGFWLVGIYTGYLSLRFETLRGEVEHYQNLLAQALEKNNATK